MNDLKTLYNAEQSVIIPIEKPEKLGENKELSDEYAHTPYTDPEACSNYEQASIQITEVELSEETLSMAVNDEETLVATAKPTNSKAPQTITWESSDDTVATVEDGVVTAVKAGTATITVTINGKSSECAVTVA